jgi:hypothetical protein
MLFSTQICLKFSLCSGMEATLGNVTVLPFLCTTVVLQSENHAEQKSTDHHDMMASMEPNSKKLTKHGGLDDLCVALPLGAIKAMCHDPLITQQPLPFEKPPISTPVHEVCKSVNLDALGRKAGSFLSCQLWSLYPSTCSEGKRQGL